MTADRLQSIVLRLANGVPTRYWLHFNYPCREPWLMAVGIYPPPPERERDRSTLNRELVGLGATWDGRDGLWTIPRTDEDGMPFGR